MTAEVYFVDGFAPYMILAASVLSILWGVVNAILIKSIDMDDVKPIEAALIDAEIEIEDVDPSTINEEELEMDEEKIKKSP
jgi:hypothetical protein